MVAFEFERLEGLFLAQASPSIRSADPAARISNPALLHAQGLVFRSSGKGAGGLVRRRLWIVAIILAVLVVVGLFAQEPTLIGRYDDALYIDQPKDDTEQFVFARLIYNGRIPGYYKNWYTDYPKSDQRCSRPQAAHEPQRRRA